MSREEVPPRKPSTSRKKESRKNWLRRKDSGEEERAITDMILVSQGELHPHYEFAILPPKKPPR